MMMMATLFEKKEIALALISLEATNVLTSRSSIRKVSICLAQRFFLM